MQNFPIPYLSAFVIGFAYFLASAKTVEAFATVINEKLLSLILNLVLISVLVVMLRRFGENVKSGLIIAASLLSGILLGYLVLLALLGR
ncbi:hypothetical protein Igag_1985 [Ignisphaera aggregans DSM 17230]|uniref:Uncharacterized protein n=1 Tax=Ignisphaera aggregans (strain DSM 17230 / JCM 13409 / AQ1.S1) TaxID=583356 RepID=E0STJ0_IGNAA|nr:hypothetical protein Igag_1985 [Ignisphaera aggregans DSM 17230]